MNLKPYPEYEDSGFEWLEQVPKSWHVDKFRHVFTESSEVNGLSPVGEMLSISGYRGVEIKNYDDENQKRSDEQLETYRVVRAGQLAVNTMWLNYAGLGVSTLEGHVSPAYRAYWIRPGMDHRYVHHLMRSSVYVDGYAAYLTGIRPNSLQMSRPNLMSFPVVVPPLLEQKAIADYLDRETAELDAFIADQEDLIALLGERRTATITHAVTKGVDPDAPSKDSGDEWAGPVPVHWTVPALKHLMDLQTGVTLGKVYGEGADEYPYLRVANVQVGYVDMTDVKTVRVTQEIANRSMLRSGDVLMTEGGDRDKLGRGCIWTAPVDLCLHQNHVFAVRCRDSLMNAFLVYVLDSQVARNYFHATGKQTTNLAATNSSIVKNFRFGLPPVAEQLEILTYLDRETAEIDAAIADAREAITLSKERRAAMISAAVTGKIDVRGAVAPVAPQREVDSVGAA